MEAQSVNAAIVAGFFTVVGIVTLVLRKDVIEFYYETAGRFPFGLHTWFQKSTLLVIHTIMASLITIGGFLVFLMMVIESNSPVP